MGHVEARARSHKAGSAGVAEQVQELGLIGPRLGRELAAKLLDPGPVRRLLREQPHMLEAGWL